MPALASQCGSFGLMLRKLVRPCGHANSPALGSSNHNHLMPKPKKQTKKPTTPKTKPVPKTVDNPQKTSTLKFAGPTW